MGIVGSQVDGKDRAGIVKDRWETMMRHGVWVNSPGKVSQIDSQTCDVVVLRIFPRTTGDCTILGPELGPCGPPGEDGNRW